MRRCVTPELDNTQVRIIKSHTKRRCQGQHAMVSRFGRLGKSALLCPAENGQVSHSSLNRAVTVILLVLVAYRSIPDRRSANLPVAVEPDRQNLHRSVAANDLELVNQSILLSHDLQKFRGTQLSSKPIEVSSRAVLHLPEETQGQLRCVCPFKNSHSRVER